MFQEGRRGCSVETGEGKVSLDVVIRKLLVNLGPFQGTRSERSLPGADVGEEHRLLPFLPSETN